MRTSSPKRLEPELVLIIEPPPAANRRLDRRVVGGIKRDSEGSFTIFRRNGRSSLTIYVSNGHKGALFNQALNHCRPIRPAPPVTMATLSVKPRISNSRS